MDNRAAYCSNVRGRGDERKPKYICRSCKYSFETDTPFVGNCPKCNNIYVDWINYDAWDAQRGKRND
jgi:rubrerythrin